jgi:hypothetical protein
MLRAAHAGQGIPAFLQGLHCRVRGELLKSTAHLLPHTQAAKRAVAVALRNRWRRHRLPAAIAEEV